MKKILAAIVISIFALSAARSASAFTSLGPVMVNLSTINSEAAFYITRGKTNSSHVLTNIVLMVESVPTQTHFDGAALLALLANSYNTNFPVGSQIGMDLNLGGIFVLDRTGTNILFAPSGVISFQFEENFISGTKITERIAEYASRTNVSGTVVETAIASAIMNYDDTFKTTADGTHTRFAFKGLYTVTKTQNLKARTLQAILQFQGTGGGPVRDVPTVLTGTISGKRAGSIPIF